MRTLALFTLVASLSLAGCLDEERTITLEPDGRGTLTVVRTGGKESSAALTALHGGDAEEAALRFAVEHLDDVVGVVAWTDVVASVTSDGRLRFEATGWFEDASRVAQVDRDGEERPYLVVTREGATWRVAVPTQESDERETLDVAEVLPLVRRMIEGLRLVTVVHLPGDVVEASGWTQEGRTLRKVVDEARLRPALEGLPPGQAGAAELLRRMDEATRAEATVRVPDGASSAAFTERLRAAVAAWEASPWRRAVEGARRGDWSAEGLRPPPGPDRFEPNDQRRAARPLQPGTYGGLVAEAGGEDWYSVRVPAGHELRVAARPDRQRGGLILHLYDASRRRRASGLWLTPAAGARLAAVDAEQTFYARVAGDDTPYTLVVEVVPYAPGDAFEPNDDAKHAAALPPGKHEDLVVDSDDWYRVTGVEAGRAVEVRVRKTAPGELAIDARGPDGRPLEGRRLGPNDDRALLRQVVPEGGLLLHVSGAADSRYEIELAEVALVTDALEPNDGPGEARPLEPGTYEAVLEGEDWYRVEVAPGKKLRVRADVRDDAAGELSLEAYVPGSTEAPQERSVGTLTIARRRPGPYLVRVTGRSAVTYSLEVVEEPFAPEDAFEPNDVEDEAAPLADGSHQARAGHDDDWYAVDLPAGARLRLALVVTRGLLVTLEAHGVHDDGPRTEYVRVDEDTLRGELVIDPAPRPRTIRLRVSRGVALREDRSYTLEVATEHP